MEEIHLPGFQRVGWGVCRGRGSSYPVPVPNSDLEPPWGVVERLTCPAPRACCLARVFHGFLTTVPKAHQPLLQRWCSKKYLLMKAELVEGRRSLGDGWVQDKETNGEELATNLQIATQRCVHGQVPSIGCGGSFLRGTVIVCID